MKDLPQHIFETRDMMRRFLHEIDYQSTMDDTHTQMLTAGMLCMRQVVPRANKSWPRDCNPMLELLVEVAAFYIIARRHQGGYDQLKSVLREMDRYLKSEISIEPPSERERAAQLRAFSLITAAVAEFAANPQ